MTIVRNASLLAASIALVAGCAGTAGSEAADSGRTSTADASAAPGATESAWRGDTIPEGTYAKTATLADARRLGLPKDKIAEVLGPDGEFNALLKIVDDNWAQFGDESGDMAIGDGGASTYDADGHWLATSGEGSGPVQTFEWTLNGNQLTLTMLDNTEVGSPADLLVARLVMEGTYTRQ
jgi:hypothetical protein